jgi:two-component system, LytTR family, response regulator
METISVIIVDDEKNARELLESLIHEIPGFSVTALCDGVDSAWQKIKESLPDAIFLDIQMPLKDGFVLVEMLQQLDNVPEIIFTTAFEKFSVQAIKAAAFDYLLKPVKKEELKATLCRLRLKFKHNRHVNNLQTLLENLSSANKIRLNDRHGFHIIDPNQVVYILAEGSYCKFVINDGREITASINIGKASELVPNHFFKKVSRSCIINTNYLIRVDRKNLRCDLKADKVFQCTISKNYIKHLETIL